ncbi:hypothetical protein CERZMDRAFT_97882 [Cercospora zeae-maydis SCOH1-5]|uniref:DUF7730 domain-containing protein n=1 Tax=Cercospora zeae-maydis SCOH1-5 TaxID=717836 RepID=A0A6A6FF08_9PEZI|nr:hypothetical protein CERZMDRAFT_97882 [Cercospora zeae-maydis SCOH1-5]
MAPTSSKPEPREATSFLDLPPELRNRIYELCLIVRSDRAIRAVVEFRPDVGKVRRQVQRHVGTPPSRPYELLEVTPKLLATCRQIYQEAMPVLYGRNLLLIRATSAKVSYPRPGGAYRFPPPVQAMRIVELRGAKKQEAIKSVLLVLQHMVDLNTLRIDGRLLQNFQRPHTMAKALLPLVQSKHAQRQGTDRKQAMDVIEFTNLRHFVPKLERHQMSRAFAEKVKAILQKSLDEA